MELSIIKQLKELRNILKRKPKKVVETVIKVSKPVKEPKRKFEDTVVHINCNPMTLKEIAEKYGLEIKTVQARYKVGNRGKLLTRPSNRTPKDDLTNIV
jgi:LysM repeat protein